MLVSNTITFIQFAHKNQVDKNGEEYWKHPYRVMNILIDEDDDTKNVALLHDVVEDTNFTFNQLSNMGYNDNVINALKLVTKDDNLTYFENINRIIESRNKIAIKVKIADNMDNLNPSRIKQLNNPGLKKRYNKSLTLLKKALYSIN